MITFSLYASCFTDVEKDLPLESKVLLGKPVININDSLRDIQIEKSYIFNSRNLGNAFSYGDLLKLENGKLLIACNTNKILNDWSPVNLIISESSDNGKTWKVTQKIEHTIEDSYINAGGPSLINIGNGHIMLFFCVKYSDKRIDIMYKESFDYGTSWGKDKVVYGINQGYITSNNNRVSYSNNRILVPVAKPNDENNLYKSAENNFSVFFYFSDDLGATWQRSNVLTIPGVALLEPDIVRINKSELLMNIRVNLGFILFARSKDNGSTWVFESSTISSSSSPQKITVLPKSNNLIMVWNYVKTNNQWHHIGNRNPLSIAISSNNGYDWEHIADIENNQDFDYSYPSMTLVEDTIYITYYEFLKVNGNHSLKLAKIAINDITNE